MGGLQFAADVSTVLFFVLVAVKAFAFVNAMLWSERHYDAAGKLTKAAWCLICGLALVAELIGAPLILNVAGLVAALVYLVDVRPAMQALTRR